ncbi:butyrophilin subfamily 3 member A1-like [Aythya fuligula]|uniref:Butyrophilin subfamily 3 member A1-like n=1 Tax=Aythya fuligula TaxID=219594 RepID=A0A6J3EI39_AYTFU|nr:butyrophilin subfamily 3 member A1-like [Aythya fuligula]
MGHGGRSTHQLTHNLPFDTHFPQIYNGKISPLLCAFLHCPTQLRVVGPDQPLTATVGQDVVLPCHLSPHRDARDLEVRWIRDSISETVHHYRNGQDLYGEQMEAYAGRTELPRDGLSAGSLELRITGLRPSDDGQYFCTVKNADAYDEATVDLEVSDPAPAAAQMGLPWGCGRPSLTGHASSFLTSLVTLHLLQLGSAQLKVEGPDQPLTATVGQDVVLPCHLSPHRDARTLDVRWIRDHISETVHHYRNGQDLYGEQMGAYAGRTELARDGLSAGSLDLRITGLRPSDDGLYFCTVEDADAYAEAIVDLEVSATGADPHISLGGYEDGGVRVLCRSAGWYPLPQLLWRDDRGQHLPSVSQTNSQDQEGLFEIESAVIMTGSMEGPLSCVVRSSRVQQERESSLHIAAPFFHNAQPWMVALAPVLVLLAVSIGLGVYLFRKQAAQSQELGESLQSLPPAPGEVVSLREVRKDAMIVKVTLDPDTAHTMLFVSQDNSSVRRESERQQVPDTPERFDIWWCVLGHEEFREGRHCWLVEVEGEPLKNSWWAVGVARASVERKKWINMSPKEGIWAVQYFHGQLMSLTYPRIHLSLSPVPTRIWVCLDCTQQQVSFINADNGVQIFTFTAASFNGASIHPWFWVETLGIQLCLRDSTPPTPSRALGTSCPSPDTPASPLLGPAGAAQE